MSMNSTAIPEVNTSPSDPNAPRPRLHYLDGVRAVACLVVMVGHFIYVGNMRIPEFHLQWLSQWLNDWINNWINNWLDPLYAVAVFIVLSGYCLAIPIAKSHDLALLGGVAGYLKRRARRILPPYYAALGLSLLLFAAVFGMRSPTGPTAGLYFNTLPMFDAGSIVSHLLLIHNLNGRWAYTIDDPMWSVGTEWQIYFLLPLLLLPVWRKWGLAASVLTGLVIGLYAGRLPCHTLWNPMQVPEGHFGFYLPAHPEYLGLFALGMAGAAINFSPRYAGLRDKPWGIVGLVALADLIIAGLLDRAPRNHMPEFLSDILKSNNGHMPGLLVGILPDETVVGVAVTCMLIVCTRCLMRQDGKLPRGLRFLGSKPLVALGIFSYSLYLIHYPLMQMFMTYAKIHFEAATRNCILLFCGMPLCIAIAYAFHRIFERPFMNLPRKGSNT
jgi:peptidoglycan/LPS O-acetylase OafA/YrhL